MLKDGNMYLLNNSPAYENCTNSSDQLNQHKCWFKMEYNHKWKEALQASRFGEDVFPFHTVYITREYTKCWYVFYFNSSMSNWKNS